MKIIIVEDDSFRVIYHYHSNFVPRVGERIIVSQNENLVVTDVILYPVSSEVYVITEKINERNRIW